MRVGGLTARRSAGGSQRGGLVVVDCDRLVQAGQRQDLPVVLRQADGEQLLARTLGSDKERHQEADAARVHVVELAEVQDDGSGVPGLGIGRHDRRLTGPGDLAMDPEDRGRPITGHVDGGVGLATVRASSGRTEQEAVTALEELVRRGIVREVASGGDPAFDFGHASLRDAAYEGTGLARRRLLHRRVAEALRAGLGGRDEPGRLVQIAGHEQAAGMDAVAAESYRAAGLGARRVHANREALLHFETALALGHPDAAGLQIAVGEVRTALGDYAGAVVALEAAAGLVPDTDLPGIELRLGRVHGRRGDVATAASHLDAALAGADDRLRPTVLVERGAVALRADELDDAASLAGGALDAAAGTGDARTTGAASRLLGLVALRRGELGDARSALRRAVAVADEDADGDPGASIAARNGLALVEAAADDREAAIALLEAALAESRRTGETHLEAAVENNLADQLHAAGRSDEAMAHLKRAVALFAEVGGRPDELEPEIWKLVAW